MVLTITEVPYGKPLFSDTFHMALYFLYGSTGVVYVLEGNSQVPAESSRLTFAVTQAFEFMLLMIHADKKKTEVAVLQHQLLGVTVLISCVCQLLSIQYKNWLAPYVIFLGAFIWQALWWITIGFCFLAKDLKYGDVSVYFCLEGMLVYFGGLVLASKLERVASCAANRDFDNIQSIQKAQRDEDENYERAALMRGSEGTDVV